MIFFVIKGYSIKTITSFIKHIINEFPFAQFSTDKNFHTYQVDSDKRYSLFYLPFGTYKFYFLTWGDTFSWKFFNKISLSEITNKRIDEKEIRLRNLVEKNYTKYRRSTKEEKQLHIKILEDKCKEQENRKSVAQFKSGFYFTGLLFILTTIIKNISAIGSFWSWSLYQQIILSLIFLYIINVFLLLFSFISVKGSLSEKYTTFARSNEKEKSFYIYWYKKYQRLEARTTRDVSFIVNIEKYLKLIITWSIIFTLILIIGGK
jgi:hypothetical protein